MSTLVNRKTTKKLKTTPFSEFIRNASSAEKKRVYSLVLKKASIRQQELIEKSKADISEAENNNSAAG